MSSDCLFCKIVAGTVPASKIHEDDQVIVISDINPQAPLHALVIPRRFALPTVTRITYKMRTIHSCALMQSRA